MIDMDPASTARDRRPGRGCPLWISRRNEIDDIPSEEYLSMPWNVEYTEEFGAWYEGLAESIQDDVDRTVGLLEARGPQLPFLYSSGIEGSKHRHMRELRVQSGGQPIRIFYAFDPRRSAILLIGGNKTGNKRFYEEMIAMAERLYDVHIAELRREGLIP
jgi:hypothetical protein